MKRAFAVFATASAMSCVLLAAPVAAQFANSDDAIDYRQSAFTVMGNHMGRLAAMAKGERPFDAEQAQRSAELVKTFSALPWEGFLPGSSGGKSKVKGDPWASADDFKSLQQSMRTEAAKLPTAAGSLDTLRAQVGATGKACKACHDKFREK